MHYNVDYEVAASILCLVIFVYHCLKYQAETEVNREFRKSVFAVFLCNFLDALTATLINYVPSVPNWLNMFLNTVFFLAPITMTYCLLRYVVAYIYDHVWDSKLIRVMTGVYLLDILCILINVVSHWMFYFDEQGNYQHGPLFVYWYLLPLVFMVLMGSLVIVRKRYFSKGQLRAILLLVSISILAALVQFLVCPQILITNFVAAICILNIFFFLETPDYQKMIHTMADLEYLQANLKDEVVKQTKVATERREKVEQMSLQMVQTLASTIDAKDRYTNGHSSRVAYYSVVLARYLGWNEEAITNLRYKGLLHDIGKIGVADAILNKPSRLKKVEYEVIQSHTIVGYEILQDSGFLPGAEEVARYHHERYDGLGYPDGLKGDEIPADARIVAIADSFDAMNSDRIYRKALSTDVIRAELIAGRGKQFDPEYLDAFVKLLDAGKLVIDTDAFERPEEAKKSGRLMRKVMESMQAQNKAENVDFLSGVMRREDGEDSIVTQMSKVGGCIALLEVRNLKLINEKHGRLAGDKVIAGLGGILKDRRDELIASRNGGSQFLCFAFDVDEVGIYDILDRIYAAFDNFIKEDPRLSEAQLYAGLCMTEPEDDYFDAYGKADKALYHVVQTGKSGYFFYRHLNTGLVGGGEDLNKLVEALKSNHEDGALAVEYEDFTRFYEYIMNLWKRYHHSFVLTMITINQQGDDIRDYESLEKAMGCMEHAVRRTIRTVDVCTRYSSSQLLVILLEVGEENVNLVIKRIFQDYYKMYSGREMEVSYEVADLNLEK